MPPTLPHPTFADAQYDDVSVPSTVQSLDQHDPDKCTSSMATPFASSTPFVGQERVQGGSRKLIN